MGVDAVRVGRVPSVGPYRERGGREVVGHEVSSPITRAPRWVMARLMASWWARSHSSHWVPPGPVGGAVAVLAQAVAIGGVPVGGRVGSSGCIRDIRYRVRVADCDIAVVAAVADSWGLGDPSPSVAVLAVPCPLIGGWGLPALLWR